jgi:hypothetical protein
MSTHVNLMKSGEFRRQGAVSGAFVVQVCIFSTLAFGLVFGALGFMHFQIARKELEGAREVWKMREPRYNTLQSMRNDLTELQKIREELEGWANSRVHWDERFLKLQEIVPAAMQFRRVMIRGDHDFIREGKGATAVSLPGRIYVISMEGRIVSDNPVAVVNQFMDSLARAEGFQGLLSGVRMPEGLKQESSQSEVPEARFIVEATTERLAF